MKYGLIEGRINVICPYVTCKETFKMHVKGEAVIFSSPVLSNYFFFIYILIIHCSLSQISVSVTFLRFLNKNRHTYQRSTIKIKIDQREKSKFNLFSP